MHNDSTILIKSNSISVYICRSKNDRMEILLLNREESANDEWEVTCANVKPMEMCWQAALNEVRTVTSAVPDRIYSVDMVSTFYDVKTHTIMMEPVFLAFFDYEQDTMPMLPGVGSMWVDAYDAEQHLTLSHEREVLKLIFHEFFTKTPAESQKVYPTRFWFTG